MVNHFFPLLLVSLLGLAGCDNKSPAYTEGNSHNSTPAPSSPQRWYTQEMVTQGGPLFQAHCAVCHQPDASGTANWREPLPDGKYPPPPLNGTAHTWHHPLASLRRTIKTGGIPLGGYMPAFGNTLSDKEIDNLLAWIQSHWSDEIYLIWEGRNRKASQR